MDAREYLTQILELKRRMDKLKEKIRRYKEIASSPRSPSLEEHYNPNPNTASPFEKPLLEINALEKELEEMQRIFDAISLEARFILCQLDDEDVRLTLQYKYLEGMNKTQIARMLDKSTRSIFRYEVEGLKTMKLPSEYTVI